MGVYSELSCHRRKRSLNDTLLQRTCILLWSAIKSGHTLGALILGSAIRAAIHGIHFASPLLYNDTFHSPRLNTHTHTQNTHATHASDDRAHREQPRTLWSALRCSTNVLGREAPLSATRTERSPLKSKAEPERGGAQDGGRQTRGARQEQEAGRQRGLGWDPKAPQKFRKSH